MVRSMPGIGCGAWLNPLWRKFSSSPPVNPSPPGLPPRDVPSSCSESDSAGVSAVAQSACCACAAKATRHAAAAPQQVRAGVRSALPRPGDHRMLDPKTIRNVAIIEALLRHDAPSRASKDGSTSHLDVDPEEVKRNFTVATHITFAEHEGVLMNLLDAPGFSDFLTDADRSMAVVEGGLRCQAPDGSTLGHGDAAQPASACLCEQGGQGAGELPPCSG